MENERIFNDEEIAKMNEERIPLANAWRKEENKRKNCFSSERFAPHRTEWSYEERQMIALFYKECPKGMEVDHIIPLKKGGKHCMSNLQWLSKKENVKKFNKIIFDDCKYPKCLLSKNF